MKLFIVASLLPLFQAVVPPLPEERCDDGSCHATSHSTDNTELLQVGHEILSEKDVTTAEDRQLRDRIAEGDDEELLQKEEDEQRDQFQKAKDGDADTENEEDAESDNEEQTNRKLTTKRKQRHESAMQVQSETSGGCWWNEDMDVAYGSGTFQKVDLYWPKREKPKGGWSAVIMIHGEGPTNGRHTMAGFCKQMLRDHGYCFSGGYDQTNGKEDVYALTNWVYQEAAKRGINKAMIVLAGHSLGALIINDVLFDKNMGRELLQGDPAKLRSVMLFDGVSKHHAKAAEIQKYWPENTFIMCPSGGDESKKHSSYRMYYLLEEKTENAQLYETLRPCSDVEFNDGPCNPYSEASEFLEGVEGRFEEAKEWRRRWR